MALTTAIEWCFDPFLDQAGSTWSRWYGCTRESEACNNCFIVRQAPLRMRGLKFSKVAVGGETPIVMRDEKSLFEPLTGAWKAPRIIFPNDQTDLWHGKVNKQRVAEMFAVMLLARQHIFMTLTKRTRTQRNWLQSDRFVTMVLTALDMVVGHAGRYGVRLDKDAVDAAYAHLAASHIEGRLIPLQNVWIGATVENNDMRFRIDELADTPAAMHWLSCEPLTHELTDPLDLNRVLERRCPTCNGEGVVDRAGDRDYCDGCEMGFLPAFKPGWIIAGGESGPAAKATDLDTEPAPGLRPLDLDNLQMLIDECRGRDIPVFVKQLGEPAAKANGWAHKKGGDPDEWPVALRVREYPRELLDRAVRVDPGSRFVRYAQEIASTTRSGPVATIHGRDAGKRVYVVLDRTDTAVRTFGLGTMLGHYLMRGWDHPQALTRAADAIDRADRKPRDVFDRHAHYERQVAEGKLTREQADEWLEIGRRNLMVRAAMPFWDRARDLARHCGANPLIQLDQGGYVWGAESWWAPVDSDDDPRIRTQMIGDRQVISVAAPHQTMEDAGAV